MREALSRPRPIAPATSPLSEHEVASRTDPKLLTFQKNARRRLLRCALEQQGALLKGAECTVLSLPYFPHQCVYG